MRGGHEGAVGGAVLLPAAQGVAHRRHPGQHDGSASVTSVTVVAVVWGDALAGHFWLRSAAASLSCTSWGFPPAGRPVLAVSSGMCRMPPRRSVSPISGAGWHRGGAGCFLAPALALRVDGVVGVAGPVRPARARRVRTVLPGLGVPGGGRGSGAGTGRLRAGGTVGGGLAALDALAGQRGPLGLGQLRRPRIHGDQATDQVQQQRQQLGVRARGQAGRACGAQQLIGADVAEGGHLAVGRQPGPGQGVPLVGARITEVGVTPVPRVAADLPLALVRAALR